MNMKCPGCSKIYDFLPEHSESQFQCGQCGILFGVPRIPATPQQPVQQQPVQQQPVQQQPVQQQPYDPLAGVDPSLVMAGASGDPLGPSRSVSGGGSSFNPAPFIIGGVVLIALLCCGGVLLSAIIGWSGSVGKGEHSFTELSEPVPAFVGELPERPTRWETWKSGDTQFPLAKVKLGVPPGKPGHADNVWILLPPRMPTEADAVTPGSQGCVLFTPTSVTMCAGMYIADSDLEECALYARAGFIVIAYEMDGFVLKIDDENELRQGFADFKASRAGLVNAEHAIQYVLTRHPEVDPGRLYAAGHAMSGSMAMRLAAHDNRIKGCVAYAPEIDLSPYWDGAEQELNDMLGDDEAVPFLEHYSPLAQEERIKCDLFLFHARDDENVEFLLTQEAAGRMTELPGRELEFHIANSGGHYDAMYEEGVPAGVQFLRKIDAKNK